MKNLLFLSILLFICQCVFSQITFEKSYDLYGSGTTVIAEDDGYFLSGSSNKSVLIRTDLLGDTLWKKTFPDGHGNMHLMTKSIPKEYVFLSNPSNNIKVTKMDGLGNIIWSNTIVKPNWNVPNQIIQTNDNGYLIAGQSNSLAGITTPYPYSANIIKLNSEGDTLWTKMVGNNNYNYYAYSAIETSDSHYLVTGYGYEDSYNAKALLIKMDTYGNILWKKKYGTGRVNSAFCVAETKDNNYIVAGTIYSNTIEVTSDVYALKVDKEGNVLWEKTYHLNGNSSGSKLLVLDSGFLIAGQNAGKAFLLKIGNEGNFLWSKTIMTFGAGAVKSIDKCSDGGFIFTTHYDLSLLKTDAEGCIKPNTLPIIGEGNVSINDNIVFEINDVRGETYTWKSTHGTILSGQGTNSVVMYWNEIGLDIVKVFVENDCGVDSATFNVNIQECVSLNVSKIQSSNYYTEFYVEKYEGKNPIYFWSVDKGTILSGQNSNHIKVDWYDFGDVEVSVSVTNDCSVVEEKIQITVSHIDNIIENKIDIFPNPVTEGVFYISNSHNSDMLVQIYNITGEKIISNILNRSAKQRYDISRFGKGVFIVKISDNNLIVSKKIISQ